MGRMKRANLAVDLTALSFLQYVTTANPNMYGVWSIEKTGV